MKENHGLVRGKRTNTKTNCLWKRPACKPLKEDMKTTTLNMPRELKEDLESVKKIMYGQEKNIMKKWHTSIIPAHSRLQQ
jgi:hypothetical protein